MLLFLRLLHFVDIFWNTRIPVPVSHHIFDEGDNAGCFKPPADQGDLIGGLAEVAFVVESRVVF